MGNIYFVYRDNFRIVKLDNHGKFLPREMDQLLEQGSWADLRTLPWINR